MSQSTPLIRAYIGLGSNLSSPLSQVQRAVAELAQLERTRLVRVSPFYRSSPLGPADQPDFINAVVSVDTGLSPLELLEQLQAIEAAHGRERGAERWGPRTLDLDLLLFGEESIALPQLQVPHPEMRLRSFVLAPLADIAPTLAMPGGETLSSLLQTLSPEGLERVAIGGTSA